MKLFVIAFLIAIMPKTADSGIYFPLHVGDSWSYMQTGICDNFSILRIKGDTVIDGKRYFTVGLYSMFGTTFARSDSNGVYGYTTATLKEYTLFDFQAKPGDTVSAENNSIITCLGPTRFKRTYTNSSSGIIYYLKDSIGIVSTSSTSSPCGDQLVSAIIDGIKKWPTSVVERKVTLPAAFFLSDNFPNPFNPSTTLRYGISEKSRVRLSIHNSIGQLILSLVDQIMNPGSYEYRFEGAQLSSGTYFYRLEAVSGLNPGKVFVDTKKMILTK